MGKFPPQIQLLGVIEGKIKYLRWIYFNQSISFLNFVFLVLTIDNMSLL